MNERELLDTVRINGLALTYVQEQTMEAYLEAERLCFKVCKGADS